MSIRNISLVMAGVFFSQVHAQHNALTASEQTAGGYGLLFNGTDLTNWRSYNALTAPSSWAVIAESTWKVMNIATGASDGGSIITKDSSYRDFDFKVEWATSVGGNSGIFTRYMFRGNSWGGAYGSEAQVVDITNSDGNSDKHRAGDCYDMFLNTYPSWVLNGSTSGGQPVYRYNKFRIIAFGNHVAHYGNGRKIIEYVIRSSTWNTAYALSKYATYPLYGDAHPGAIYFQNHGQTNIRFRDVRIKNLGTAGVNPWAANSQYLKVPGDTTQGLVDSLPFDAGLVSPSTGLRLRQGNPFASSNGLRVLSGKQNVTLLFGNRGNYVLRIEDVVGRTSSKYVIKNEDRIVLPTSDFARGAHILNVWADDKKIQQGLFTVP